MGTGLGTGMGSNWELEALWDSMGRSGLGRFAINDYDNDSDPDNRAIAQDKVARRNNCL